MGCWFDSNAAHHLLPKVPTLWQLKFAILSFLGAPSYGRTRQVSVEYKNYVDRLNARVAELVDALDLGSSTARCGGSSPFSCTTEGSTMKQTHPMTLAIHKEGSEQIAHATVTIAQDLVNNLYKHALLYRKEQYHPQGFSRQATPIAFIDQHYKLQTLKHLKEFLLKYYVISYLYQEIRRQKIVCVGDPRLLHVTLELGKPAEFVFAITQSSNIHIHDWKYLPFKSPLRRKYKDIDKQASNFIEEETEFKKNYQELEIAAGDWVHLKITLVDEEGKHFGNDFQELLWLQIGSDETSLPFQELFIGKQRGDVLVTQDQCIQEYFSSQLDTSYRFLITILEVLPYRYTDLAALSTYFKLKSEKKLHQKLVEVYSMRNDISLRRSMADEALRLLLNTFPVQAPESAVQAQMELIIQVVQQNPDYAVYKQQRSFLQTIHDLALKQVQEDILMQHLAYNENIIVNDEDVALYLNLTKRARTKEFIYFVHPSLGANEQELPISHESLKQFCLKEKALNHVLYHLTKA